jgi:hypothetical protein
VMLEILPDRALKGGLSIVCADIIPDNKRKMQNKVVFIIIVFR